MQITKILFVCLCVLIVCEIGYGFKRGEKGKYKDKPQAKSATAKEMTRRPESCDRKTASGDTIQVHYEGKLESGQVFDASKPRGQPFTFQLGVGSVIPGWDRGLLGMCVGEVRRLTIPPEYAYGASGVPPVIPPDATLIFETELLAIN